MTAPVLKTSFQLASASKIKTKPKPAKTVAFRVSHDERTELEREASKKQLKLSAFVRFRLFGDGVKKRKRQYEHRSHKPNLHHREIARLLSLLGQSETAPALIALADAAKSGSLPVTPHLCDRLEKACEDVDWIKTRLIIALGIKAES